MLIFKLTSPVLRVCEIQITVFVFILVVLLYKLIYNFKVDNIRIKIIDKAGFVGLNGVFKKVYYTVTFRIHLF